MANITVRQLPTADALSSADSLLIAQADGTTRSVPLNRLISEGMLASDSAGQGSMITRAKIMVGAKSVTDIYGVNRPATEEWGDKAWMLVYPGRGNTPEDLFKTDLCHFTSYDQPVPMFVLNRPFHTLHQAMIWAKYNVPGGWELQIDICGSTYCFEKGDKLGEFGPNATSAMNLRTFSITSKHRFVGTYYNDVAAWGVGKGHPDDTYAYTRWIPDHNTAGGPHSANMNRATSVANGHKDRRGLDADYGPKETLTDLYVHFGGHAGLRIWFRDIPKIYIAGLTFADYAHGPRLGNQRFFRVSNGRVHMFGEKTSNLESTLHVIANQRGCSFVTKHGSSTIFEVIEGGSVYIMCNLRHYSCGTTPSAYAASMKNRENVLANPDLAYSACPADDGISEASFEAAPQQIVKIAEVGNPGSSITGASTLVFDPLFHGWSRSLGQLTMDRDTLRYHDGTTLASHGAKFGFGESGTTHGETDLTFINWASGQNHEWLTGGHGNINDTSWQYYDVHGLNWYYRGVTPQSYQNSDVPNDKDKYLWNIEHCSASLPWQAWKMATVGAGGTYAETMPGIVKGPYVMNNNSADNYMSQSQLSYVSEGDGNYGFYDNRGYRHYMRSSMGSNTGVLGLDAYGQETANFLQHFATGKNTRIGTTIQSPCSSGYSFSSTDAKIFLAKHYSTMTYVPDAWGGISSTGSGNLSSLGVRPIVLNVLDGLYGGGITKFSFHVSTNTGTHYSSLSGGVYPCPNTLSSSVGAFKYQEGNDICDHPVLLHGSNAGAQSPQNYPTIGGSEMVKFSSFPGELKNFLGGVDSVGVGITYIAQLPVISRAESWAYQGTWNFAQYSFSHQNYYAGRTTGDDTDPGEGHNFLIPLDTYNNPYAVHTSNDDIIKYWFDLESRPAIHSFTNGINLRKEPYWWKENDPWYWNQHLSSGSPRTQGDEDP
tara:strand:- start:28789 stop:31599 length:2811 start_codon:yes stop_codon:yes gene_type:complete